MKTCSHLASGAALMVAGVLCAGTAMAEPGQFAGGFSFQTDDLIAGPGVQILSGYAIADLQNNGTYRVRVLATDYFQNAEGTARRVYAMQLCTGKTEGSEMVITCQVMNTTGTNYTPDDFRLRQNPDVPNAWQGTLNSSGTAAVEFIDLD